YQRGVFPVAAASSFVRLALLRTGLEMRYLGSGTPTMDLESGPLEVAVMHQGHGLFAGRTRLDGRLHVLNESRQVRARHARSFGLPMIAFLRTGGKYQLPRSKLTHRVTSGLGQHCHLGAGCRLGA